MAAIDPTAAPEADESGNLPSVPRSTLKLIRLPTSDSDSDDDDEEEDDEYLKALVNASDDDEEESSDEEANGGPSDPSKSKKQKRAEALASLMKAAKEEGDSDAEMADAKPNGVKSAAKGKGKAVEKDKDEGDSEDEDDVLVPEEFVICTLDTERVGFTSTPPSYNVFTRLSLLPCRPTNNLSTSLCVRMRRSTSWPLVLTPSR